MKNKRFQACLAAILAASMIAGSGMTTFASPSETPTGGFFSSLRQMVSQLAGTPDTVPRDQIKSIKADSTATADYSAEKAIDGIENDANNCWHSPWSADAPGFPHYLQVEFKTPQFIDSFTYVARSETGFQFISQYEIWVSPTADESGLTKVAEGTWTRAKTAVAKFDPVEAVLVKFVMKAKVDSNPSDTYSASASEIKFGIFKPEAGMYNDEITAMCTNADTLLAYATDIGNGVYQYKQAAVDELTLRKNELFEMMDSAELLAVKAKLKETEQAMTALLNSNKTPDEEQTVPAYQKIMKASASTHADGYEAGKAIDNDSSSIWHSSWTPSPAPFPHFYTLDMGRSYLFDRITILPRQDQSNGRILSGEIYAGDSEADMKLVKAFTASNSKSPVEVPLPYTHARFIQIKSISGAGGHSSLAELNVHTYERGFSKMNNTYDQALMFVESAESGSEIGQFQPESIASFKDDLDAFAVQIADQSLNNSQCYALAQEIAAAKDAFAAKANAYSIEHLTGFIANARALHSSLTNDADKQMISDAIDIAASVEGNPDSTKEQIHQAAQTLKTVIDGLSKAGDSVYALAGKWNFSLSDYKAGQTFDETVNLPGTLDENRKGSPNAFKDPRRLSRYYTYTGAATYQKNVMIPNSWSENQITLFMERSRETRVFVNGNPVLAPETSNMMATSQTYDLTSEIEFGKMNSITIVVDNSYPTTPRDAIVNSSMATEETQTNWNGILGDFELRIQSKVNIDDLRVYPNADLLTATVEVDVENASAESANVQVNLAATGLPARTETVTVPAGETVTLTVSDYDMGENVKLWSEFEQNLYTMTAALDNGDHASDTFGMRVFGVDPVTKQLVNNDAKVFLRNEANCAVFPLTAYAPMDEAGWEKLFTTYQSFGLNSVRFHSWCPPEAAFDVADRLGMFLQPELSCWDAGSMFGTQQEKTYYANEAQAIIKEYANHPSFVMFSFGNELVFAGDGYAYADKLITDLKANDSTRLYTFASNGSYGGYAPTANSDFFTGQTYQGTALRGIFAGMSGFINQTRPATTVNYNGAVKRGTDVGKPVFSFEVGQFQVFPDVLAELDGYTGVLEPRNLQLVVDKLEATDTPDAMTEQFIDASGMLSRIGYRMEIEAALRTKNMSGISLLGIQDFSGQSTALVGMMNALGDAKPYDFATPSEFARFFSPEVALLETSKFVWENNETLTGKLLLANYGPADITAEAFYSLKDKNGTELAGETLDSTTFVQGTATSGGELSIDLSSITAPSQLILEIGVNNAINYYDIWVYPAEDTPADGEVFVSEFLSDEAMSILDDGGKVLLSPKVNKTALPNSITGTFTTAFWSSQFVSDSQPGSMGLLMDPQHPVFSAFPTEYHSNYQWWAMAKLGRPMVLEDLKDAEGNEIEPLIRVLDSFTTIRTMGLLYEAKVGNGKLMVSSMGLDQLAAVYPEAKALKKSILDYMNSEDFDPQFEADPDVIRASVVGTEVTPRVNIAEKSNGGNTFLGENTKTCQIGYDNHPQDRALELNDGRVDVDTSSRSWTDWTGNDYPYDAEVGVIFAKESSIDTVVLPFFEDFGCKAPTKITLEYWDGEQFIAVSNPSKTTGFAKGNNTITFTPVSTTRLRAVMEHAPKMGVALSEFIVYEQAIPATSIAITGKGGQSTVNLGETLQMELQAMPQNANDTAVRWSVLDENGEKSTLASITINGVLKTKASGKVTVKATLKSDATVTAQTDITIVSVTSFNAQMPDVTGITGTKDTEVILPFAITAFPSDMETKAIEGVIKIPEGLTVTNVEKSVNVTAQDAVWHQDGQILRFAFASIDDEGTPITFAQGSDNVLVRLTARLNKDFEADADLQLTTTRFLLRASDGVEKVYGLEGAKPVISIKAPIKQTVSVTELFVGGGELIPAGKKAVSFAFTGVDKSQSVSYNDIPLHYNSQRSDVHNQVVYVGFVDETETEEALSDITNYAFTAESPANLVFGNTDQSVEINAQDAINVLSAWLRKNDISADEAMILAMNVSADNAIDTQDAIGIVDNYINSKSFAVVEK